MRRLLLSLLLIRMSPAPPCQAHGDVHQQIVELNQQIEKDPRNAELYLRRGELYRLHQLFDAALVDLDHAADLSLKLDILDFARGQLFSEAGWPLSARAALDRHLARHTNHVDGYIVRSRVLHTLGERGAAARDLATAIRLSPEPGPELFIERAQICAEEATNHSPHEVSPYHEALQCLDDGIARLGSLVTLQLYAIEIELQRTNYNGALGRVDKLITQSPRKENWLMRRGEILLLANRPTEARDAFSSALTAMGTMPPARRLVPAVKELERRIQTHLDTIANSTNAAPNNK